MRLKREVLLGGIVTILGAALLAYIRHEHWTGFALAGTTSPGFFPMLSAVTMACGGVTMILSRWVEARHANGDNDDVGMSASTPEGSVLAPVGMWLGAVAYAALLPYVGFLVATPLFVVLLVQAWERRRWALPVSFAIAYTAGLYWIFEKVLTAPLPAGLFG